MSHSTVVSKERNEFELLEFNIQDKTFGINVIKVKSILLPVPVTFIPHSHPYIDGIASVQDGILPVINLSKALGLHQDVSNVMKSNEKFIVAEFNQVKVILHVSHVSQIYRLTWEDIEEPVNLSLSNQTPVIGVYNKSDGMTLMLDFEKILHDIRPQIKEYPTQSELKEKRQAIKGEILLAEDSVLLRNMLKETLEAAGYINYTFFPNGKELYQFLTDAPKEQLENVKLVITDIEMPKMDGHHLTHKLKQTSRLQHLPVIIFSSLITEDLKHIGERLGVHAQVSKPNIETLVEEIDQLIFI